MRQGVLVLAIMASAFASVPARAHFQEILPATDHYAGGGPLNVDLVFTHPMEGGPVMPMARPARVGVMGAAGIIDLSDTLAEIPQQGQPAWQVSYTPPEPGNYAFFVEPQPYWEPAEGKSIIHYAKVIVDAYDWGEGWDIPVGLPVEIVPTIRPYGLWAGNVFSGTVLRNGEPLPFAEIEVEWRNDGSVTPPSAAHVTQVLKADAQGQFHYGLPRAGWWGFAALLAADITLPDPSGTERPVELGGLLWVRAETMN